MNAYQKMHLLTDSSTYNTMGVALYDCRGSLVNVDRSVADRLSTSGLSPFLTQNLFDTAYLSKQQKEQLKKGNVVNEIFPIGFSVVPALDTKGSKFGYTLLLTDSSDIRKTPTVCASQIREMDYLMEKMIESIPDTVLFVNEDCRVEKVIVNENETGLTADLVNCRIDELPGVLYPGKIGKRIVNEIRRCLQGTKTISLNLPMRRETDEALFLKVRMVPVRHKHVIVFLRNQTELIEKEKENKRLSLHLSEQNSMMRLALEKSNVTAFSFDFSKHGKCDQEHCRRCFQFYGSANTLLERNKFICRALLELKNPTDRCDFYHLFNTIRDQRMGESRASFQLKNNDGEYRHYEVCGKVQEYDKDGVPRLIIGTITDNQEQLEYERSLIKAKEKAETADQLKSTFLANMTHEIRTPLHAIVGFSDLLSIETDPESREEYMNVIKANNEMLMGLINDVLDMSKIEANMMTFTIGSLDVPSWMQEMYSTVHLRMPAGVQLVLDPCIPVVIDTDKKRMTQVMTNLLTNAIKHTEEGCIRFGYTLSDKEINFYVSDTGAGIPEEQLEHIFSRFTQLQGAKQGIGLGLAICKGLVTKMGGSISVTSQKGVGSTFAFTFPTRK